MGHLILSRRPGQKVLIGDNVTIEVVEVRGDKVRLSFQAPGDVPIHREELRRNPHLDAAVKQADADAEDIAAAREWMGERGN